MSATVYNGTLFPAESAQRWEVVGFGRRNERVGSPVYLVAKTESGALKAARQIRQMLGMKRATTLHARHWSPEFDRDIQSWARMHAHASLEAQLLRTQLGFEFREARKRGKRINFARISTQLPDLSDLQVIA